ncbi:hypothetical protein [Flavobacterium sp.]|jgi:hypothetical protein|uniref:hypothetical protein n=1 Tax=Flavobacterium sp. TaxID=239 RepID=UPI0037BE93C5
MNIDKYQKGYNYAYEEIEKGECPQNMFDDWIIFTDEFSRGVVQCCLNNGAEE